MTEDLLKAIAAKTNAIDAVNDALKAEWVLIENLTKLAAEEAPDLGLLRDGLAELRALNAALPAAVVANVAPATAGPVGKSVQEHVFEQADAVVAEGLARVADAAKKAEGIAEGLRAMFESLHTSANAIGAGKAMKEASSGA